MADGDQRNDGGMTIVTLVRSIDEDPIQRDETGGERSRVSQTYNEMIFK